MSDTAFAEPTAMERLLQRASVPARSLQAPGPDERTLSAAVAAALRAPDHGGLRPWRFVFVEGEARRALGEVCARALAVRAPATSPERLQIEREKPLRAPLVVVAGAAIRHDRPGVPPWEQEATVAAGTMNFLNALELAGFGSIWLSSDGLRDPAVKTALGFAATDTLLGWLYVGTPGADRPKPERPAPEAYYRNWTPAAP